MIYDKGEEGILNVVEIIIGALCDVYYLILSVAGSGSFPKKLTAQEEAHYIEQLAKGDSEARKILIEHNLRLVAHVTKKYMTANADNDDMVSIGTIGLIKAVDSFKPDKGTRFSSYAARCIENECLMYLRSAKKSSQDVYISEPIDTDSHGNELTLIDVIAQEDTIADDLDLKFKCEKLRDILGETLDEREKQIIIMRYGICSGEPLTQKQVAQKLDISRSYVSRIEKKAIERLRKKLM
ncbi:MAG: RNA polymerase sporulation sigma factor SigK [Clostridia bacterium]|nr:RNA polymerase sporulation sigma factor SigK [Clostridia bacterium]